MSETHHHHEHEHGHDHGHRHDHSHVHMDGHGAQTKVGIAALVTFLFMFAEVAGGLISGSLALLADAAHMLTDAGSLLLAYFGYSLARRPADVARTFGFARFKVLAAFTNGLLLIALGLWIISEAVHRIVNPEPVMSGIMFGVAVIGLLVNVGLFSMLHAGHSHDDLNMKGALLHVMGDLLGSVVAIVAAIVIWTTGWPLIDPILSMLVAGLLFVSAVPIIRRSAHILLQGTPRGIDLQRVADGIVTALPEVSAVHHIHAWSLTGEDRMITLHVVPTDREHAIDLIPKVRAILNDVYHIDHATIELDVEPLGCDMENGADDAPKALKTEAS